MTEDTIFAPASGAPPSGVAVVRLSGPGAGEALAALASCGVPEPRRATLAEIRDGLGGPVLDRGLVLWFPGPRSFTGEDVAELHLHGGRAVVAAVLTALGRRPGLRLAEPGEFSRRAFLAGKLDLTAVEGLADLVAAETEAQRRQALRQMEGGLARLYDGWRDRLVRALAHLEASIDFADEEVPDGLAAAAREAAAALAQEIAGHLADGHRGERLRTGFRMAILGPPNAGKSSLLNRLARRDAAIVSERAGTTRDVIEVHLDLGGYPVVAVDTAGLREAADEIEREGVTRARAQAAGADLRLVVLDGADLPALDPAALDLVDGTALVLVNKADLLTDPATVPASVAGRPVFAVSARTGAGLDGLLAALEGEVRDRFGGAGDAVLTRARHREALEGAVDHLDRAAAGTAPELLAEDLRLAARALGRITGRVDVEDLLDVIFRDFCIGK
ncbi:MAG: tRNA uridine-5-carboxymethylaminomethyl(34) synthesis GTPase MnmE [Hyphomicrobiales bacterium]|nr:tRNA uridine-5-carboxymethylaminomethyl(34) synthesis GTPase MnmE [Hyphomicrobiales bacterium]MCP5370467.1 tRNA uridine-5-carboxymethylaminomethyl(34) synthesis GTPase MnmE [Hyphomicrobiales bacterium]